MVITKLAPRMLAYFLMKPKLVLFTSLFGVGVGLTARGTLTRLWALNRDQERIYHSSELLRNDIFQIKNKIEIAKDPSFIERQIKEKLEMFEENDLVFVFPND